MNSVSLLLAFGILLIIGLLFGLIYLQRRLRGVNLALEATETELADMVALREQTSLALSQRGVQQRHLLNQLRTAVEVMESGPTDVSPHDALQDFVQRLRHHFELYVVTFYELDQQTKSYTPVAHASKDAQVVDWSQMSLPANNERSVVARAGRTRQPAVVNNVVQRQSVYLSHHQFPKTRSEIALPILANNELIGVLDIQDVRPNRFYTADIDTFTALGRYIATNLEKSRLFTHLRQKFQEAEMLNEITTAVNESLAVSAVLNAAAVKMVDLIPAVTHCGIGVFDDKHSRLNIKAEHPDQSTVGLEFFANDTYTVRDIIEKREPIVIDDTRKDTLPDAIRHHFARLGVRSVMIIPIMAQGDLYGSIGLDVTGDKPHTFTSNEIDLARNVANQMGNAILRARLLHAAEEARQAAEAANSAKSTFLANMSHELLTPLNVILGYSEMTLNEIEELTIPQAEQLTTDVQRVHDAGTHLLTLIDDLLDYARLDVGRMSLFLGQLDLEELVQTLEIQFAPQVKKAGNTIEWVVELENQVVVVDKDKVSRIIVNLVDNANKFTTVGHISVRIEPDPQAPNAFWQIVVQDTGIGMSEGQLQRLFRPFTQGEMSLRRRYGGSGLGLSLTQQYSQMMGGDVCAASEERHGTTMTVRLPYRVPHSEVVPTLLMDELPKHTTPVVPQLVRDKPELLVIENNALDRSLLIRYFQATPYVVRTINHGREAISQLEQHLPDLILLDLLMPEMNGFQFLNTLYNKEAWRHIPVIVITAKDLSPDERVFLHQHTRQVFFKGQFNQEQLLQCVHDLLMPVNGHEAE